ncbi:EF-hand domain-containing protein [Heterostelium album PN500]|uniref:EF-hand domain-containing protein n=1 Tax=Heterostelium pallidum (strain ATCC 26659 / Pp 5 / PN500) TaxID=670386 RepID=D3B3V9_HETP5|nr:EF-hand domain-containing protein [Heterostelium album PN500]EFA84007.1 EF-hand domain-containing protein [Heterostelium album PN500]|eukprot:XP_020436124.1 EF-hand domain-containing protein [Heterostelium album PN500]
MDSKLYLEYRIMNPEERKEKLRHIFDHFDKDKDGSLSRYELQRGFQDHGMSIQDDQISKMMDIADSNKNHSIEWDEFYNIVRDSKSNEISDIAEYWLQYTNKPIIHAPSDIPSWKLLVAGGAAGAVSRTCTSPLERLKILNQVQSMNLTTTINKSAAAAASTDTAQKQRAPRVGVIKSLVNMYKVEGFRGLFKGNGTNVIRIAPYSAIQFLSYEKYKKVNGQSHLHTGQNLFVGGSAGVTSLLFTYPLDLIRSRLTVQIHEQKYTGIADAYRKIVAEEGYRGLYKGLFTSALGVAPYVAINFTTYETLKYFFSKDKNLTVVNSLIFGAISGATAQTITYPIDLLRRRLQVQGIGGAPLIYSGPLDACKKVIKEEGVRGLYKGMIPCYLKVIPAISISFCVYELMKSLLGINTNKISYQT